MSHRRILLFREPLRRRPYGERHHTGSHEPRRHRVTIAPPGFAPIVTRRGVPRERRLA